MPETFRTLRLRDVGTARSQLETASAGNYSVPIGGVALIIGMTVCNDTAGSVGVTVEIGAGTTFIRLTNGTQLAAGQTLAPCGEMNKVGLEAGEGIYVTSSALASLDVIATILEITP